MTEAVSREHVIWAYRLLLGREPESADVVTFQLEHATSVEHLRDAFLASDEYRAGQAAIAADHMPAQSTAPSIEAISDPAELQRVFKNTARVWEALGDAEPHWSVLTTERYRAERFNEEAEHFFETGRHEIAEIGAALARNGLDWPKGTALEYGCGVGRVTWALAAKFDRTYALDISAPHLALAREHLATRAPQKDVQLLQVKDMEALAHLPKNDFFYSRIVLQHNPPPVIEQILDRLMMSLNPQGLGIFQVPTMMPSYRFSAHDYLAAVASREANEMEMHMLTQRRVFELVSGAGCRMIEVWADRAALPYQSHTFLIQR